MIADGGTSQDRCYDHSGMCDIRYLVRAFTKAQYRLYKKDAYLAYPYL